MVDDRTVGVVTSADSPNLFNPLDLLLLGTNFRSSVEVSTGASVVLLGRNLEFENLPRVRSVVVEVVVVVLSTRLGL